MSDKKLTYYLKHDLNALSDPKVLQLRIRHGMWGYGMFWALLEFLSSSRDHALLASDVTAFAFHVNEDHAKTGQFVKDCVTIGLLQQEYTRDAYVSKSLNGRLEEIHDARERAQRAAAARWGKGESRRESAVVDAPASEKDADAVRVHQKAMHKSREEKKREEETKEEKSGVPEKRHTTRNLDARPKSQGEVVDYLTQEKHIDPKRALAIAERFWLYYESKGWLVGKAPMKNWRAAATRWTLDSPTNGTPQNSGKTAGQSPSYHGKL